MTFTIDRKIMYELLKSMMKVVPKISPMPELTCFLIEADEDEGQLYLTATNLECSIQRKYKANIEAGGKFVLNAAQLFSIVERLDGDEIRFDYKDGKGVHLKCGTTEYRLPGFAASSYPKPNIPFPGETVKVPGLKHMYEHTSFAVGTDKTKPTLMGLHLEADEKRVRMTACDVKRISTAELKRGASGSLSVILPKNNLSNLMSAITYDDEMEFGKCGAVIVFMKEGLLFSTRIVDGQYVNTDMLVNSVKPDFMAKVDNQTFKAAVELISDMASMGERTSAVQFDLLENSIRISTENEVSRGKEEIEAVVVEHAKDMSFHYSAKDMKEIFKAVTGETILSVSEKGYMVVMDSGTKYMVSPVRNASVVKLGSPKKKDKVEKKTEKSAKAA